MVRNVSLNGDDHCYRYSAPPTYSPASTSTKTKLTTAHPVEHAQSLLELTDGKIENLLNIQSELTPGSALSNSINDLLSLLQDLSGGLGNIHSTACCGFAFSSPISMDEYGVYETDISIFACNDITNGVLVGLRYEFSFFDTFFFNVNSVIFFLVYTSLTS